MSAKEKTFSWETPPGLWRGLRMAGSSWEGRVASLHITSRSGDPMLSASRVQAVADRGLEGDRFFHESWSSAGRPDKAVTLIEEETIEEARAELGAELVPGQIRRNIVTRGVPLLELLDREFTIGGVVMRGVRLFEPCAHLEKVSRVSGICLALVHRSGLKAAILTGGIIRVGDRITLRKESRTTSSVI